MTAYTAVALRRAVKTTRPVFTKFYIHFTCMVVLSNWPGGPGSRFSSLKGPIQTFQAC